MFFCAASIAEQITINWLNTDGTTNRTTSCTIGGDVILPYTPTKYGYTFQGWRANYIPIKYLESTGTQWIDTGYIPKYETKMEIQFVITQLQTRLGNASCPICGRSGFNYKNFGFFTPVNGVNTEMVFFANTSYTFNFGVLGKLITGIIDLPNGYIELSYDDVIYNKYLNMPLETYAYSLYLFQCNFAGVAGDSDAHIQIRSVRLKENDALVHDFIPVLDKDGTPCMYDRVEGKFCYNQGTGQFIAGPVIGE